MTLQQLRYLCEIVRRGLHLSHAAAALHTSQPGVSKQIQLLEQELGIVIFKRRRNRILSLTDAGWRVYEHAQRALLEAENIRSVALDSENGAVNFVIATTHTQARYVLPDVVARFVEKYPNVRLEFWEGGRREVFNKVNSGEADLAIGSYPGVSFENVAYLRYGTLTHCIVAKAGHPILKRKRPSIEMVAQYPIIAHSFEKDGRWKLAGMFNEKGLEPNIVFRARDADITKTYLELGIGIAILAEIAFDPLRDKQLRAMPADHIFPPEPLSIGLNRRQYHGRHIFSFVEMLAPSLKRTSVTRALS